MDTDTIAAVRVLSDDLEIYRQMVFIRKFEELVSRMFLHGEIYGSTHLCIGQEAVSVGVCGSLGATDWVSATYRGHGHALVLGVSAEGLLAEMAGRVTGTCGGRAGSMNVVDLKHRLVGCFGIVGGSIAAATGVGLSLKLRPGNDGVSVALFGDGAVNQGYFLECLNLATIERLPVVYVCENNQYGEYTPTAASTANGIAARAASFGMPVLQVDGNDAWAVRSGVQRLTQLARTGVGPGFLLAETYRFSGHGRGDPIEYRPAGEVEAWKLRDPLEIARKRIVRADSDGVDALAEIDERVSAALKTIYSTVRSSEYPRPTEHS
jgi:TPP-dependent pyruvate/acetoin dehydrogenase alpha subunit